MRKAAEGGVVTERFSATKYTLVLAHDNIVKATTDLVDALIKEDKGSIGARIIDAERYLQAASKDLADAFRALEGK